MSFLGREEGSFIVVETIRIERSAIKTGREARIAIAFVGKARLTVTAGKLRRFLTETRRLQRAAIEMMRPPRGAASKIAMTRLARVSAGKGLSRFRLVTRRIGRQLIATGTPPNVCTARDRTGF